MTDSATMEVEVCGRLRLPIPQPARRETAHPGDVVRERWLLAPPGAVRIVVQRLEPRHEHADVLSTLELVVRSFATSAIRRDPMMPLIVPGASSALGLTVHTSDGIDGEVSGDDLAVAIVVLTDADASSSYAVAVLCPAATVAGSVDVIGAILAGIELDADELGTTAQAPQRPEASHMPGD